MNRLDDQIAFLLEADKLKHVQRSNLLLDLSRSENSAEHSWHVALWALILGPRLAPTAEIDRVIAMLLIHDLVEIDVGDHPIHLKTDWDAVAAAEDAAARRLFGLLPTDQSTFFLALWREFEANETIDAKTAKLIDTAQPLFQTLYGTPPHPEHCKIVRGNLNRGRASKLHDLWPEAAQHAMARLDEGQQPIGPLVEALPFLNTADALKSVLRATTTADGSRRENSAEHSWHLALFGLVLSEYAAAPIDMATVVRMLLLHDLVEIDAGDVPIFSQTADEAQAQAEAQAADRIFGMLPDTYGPVLRDLWAEFEAAETANAIFAKSLDRFQPPLMNLSSGGGSWIEYNVEKQTVFDRVGKKIEKGAPDLWHWVEPRITAFFAAHIEPHRK